MYWNIPIIYVRDETHQFDRPTQNILRIRVSCWILIWIQKVVLVQHLIIHITYIFLKAFRFIGTILQKETLILDKKLHCLL